MKTQTTKISEVKSGTATSQNRKPDLVRASSDSFCNPILELQKTLGNQCVQRWRRSYGIQAKLSMGAANDIYFDLAQYAPGTHAGQRLLAHDLTPVLQQRLGPVNPKASDSGVMRRPPPAGLIQRSPYKAQVLSLEEIGKDAAKERLRQQSGQIAAKVCRSIGRALTPDNCPFVFPAGETVTVVKEKVAGLWLQIDCAGVPGFGPKEQCHLLGAFARRLEPPKTEKTPSPEPPAKTPPVSEPAPEMPAEPEAPVPDRDGCPEMMSREISTAVDAACRDLLSAVAALAERPLAPLTQDAMWLSLRTTSEENADSVAEKFQRVASNLASAEIVCDDPGVLFCPANTKGYVNPYTGTIHLCKQAWSDANGLSRERMVMHEGLHACAGTSGIDEIYHDSDCGEGDVVGQGRYFRMRNTDSLACFVILLTHSGGTDLGARVRHSQGESLAVRQKPAGDISLDADPKSVQFELMGYEDVGIGKMRWIFIDSEGRKYLLRGPNADEIIAPDEDTDYVRGLYIGAKTRALLNERGVSDLELIVKCEIPEVGEKIIRLDVHFVP